MLLNKIQGWGDDSMVYLLSGTQVESWMQWHASEILALTLWNRCREHNWQEAHSQLAWSMQSSKDKRPQQSWQEPTLESFPLTATHMCYSVHTHIQKININDK